jgi:hypothetical protein
VLCRANGLLATPSAHGQYAVALDTHSGAPPARPNRKVRARAAPYVLGERCAICGQTTRGTPVASATSDGQNAILNKRVKVGPGGERKRAVFAVYDEEDGDEDGTAVASALTQTTTELVQRIFRCWECGNAYHSQVSHTCTFVAHTVQCE